MAEARVTQAGLYVEVDAQQARVTQAGLYVEVGREQILVTQAGLYVELEYDPAPAVLDASLVALLRVQAGKQAEFGTAVDPTFALPVVGRYADGQQEHSAVWDMGQWTPLVIVERVAQFATFELRGVLTFEMLPVLFSGFGEMTPTGDGPYTYAGATAPGTASTPAGYTFRFGGNDANRPQGSMVQVQDAYCEALTLTFDLTGKVILFESQWFGRWVDDNSGAGYVPAAVSVPPALQVAQGLRGTLAVQDAGTSGGAFDDLTALDCSLMQWQWVIDTGLRPAWAADGNSLYFCGVRHEMPSAALATHLRTNLTNYAITKVKANLHTFQELQLTISGDDGRELVLQMTGRWLPKFQAHDRSREEVVMRPTFQAETPATQTTTPHWLAWQFSTQWEH